jgi:ABC-type dipeptide/oligopeptide/nickel transport system ATPase component
MDGEASSGWPMLRSQPGGTSGGGSSGCGKLLLAMAMMQAISDLRHNSGELVLIRSLRIHVLRLRSTLRSSSLINGWRRSQADQRGAGMTFLSSLLSANQRIRTFSSESYQNEKESWRKENKKRN